LAGLFWDAAMSRVPLDLASTPSAIGSAIRRNDLGAARKITSYAGALVA
jgi:hypothetical protein